MHAKEVHKIEMSVCREGKNVFFSYSNNF